MRATGALLVCASIVAILNQDAHAASIDFNSVTSSQDFAVYTEDGFTLTTGYGEVRINSAFGSSPAAQPSFGFRQDFDSKFILRATDGSPFSISSVDLLEATVFPQQYGVTFIGYPADGSPPLFRTFTLDGISGAETFSLPAAFQGLVSLEITEDTGNGFSTDIVQVDNLALTITVDVVTMTARAYSGIAFPVLGEDPSIQGVLVPQLGVPGALVWRLGHWDTQNARYLAAGSDLTSLAGGQGYWLITRDPITITTTGSPPPDPPDYFGIHLGAGPGWYQLGNPYTQDIVDVSSIIVANPVTGFSITSSSNFITEQAVWVWNSAGQSYQMLSGGSSLRRFAMFWVKVNPDVGPVDVIVPRPGGITARPLERTPPDVISWTVSVTASQGGRLAYPVTLGGAEAHANVSSSLNLALPPGPPGPHLRLALKRDSGGRSEDYASLYRIEGDAMAWILSLSGAQAPGEVNLAFLGEVPADVGLRLIDTRTGSEWEVRPGQSITLAATETPRELRLTAQLVSERGTAASARPGFRAYPNPASRSTGLIFSLREAADVNVHIYDVHGRLVKRLSRPGTPAGEGVLIWDGRDERARPAGDGVYFAHCHAGTHSEILRVVRLR